MPITLKTARMRYKNPTTGQYVGVNSVGDADLAEQIQAVEDSIAPDYADLVFPVAAGQKCYHENVLHEANQAIPTSEPWTAAHWSELTLDQDISAIKNALSKSSENTNIAISAHQKHSLFWFNGSLHIALDDIAIGDTITTEGQTPNASEVTIDEALIKDIQINGTSILNQGVANIPKASTNAFGVAKVGASNGIIIDNDGILRVVSATSSKIKEATGEGSLYQAIVPYRQHESVFFGLSKLAGEDLKNDTVTVGQYPEKSKSAISDMLNAPVTISGTTPVITAKSGIRYICGECATLDITVPESGCVDVTFTSGSTPTVLTVTSAKANTTIKWVGEFDPSSLEANTQYEINVMDGEWGMAVSWT